MRRFKKLKKVLLWLAAVLLIILVSLIYVDVRIKPVVLSIAETRVRALAARAINEAVRETAQSQQLFENLVIIERDSDGHVSALTADSVRINLMGAQAAKLAQDKMEQSAMEYLDIPAGTLAGVQLLAGRGPSIRVHTVPMGAVAIEYKSQFDSAGINQTRHRIYVVITMQIRIVIPLNSSNIIETASEVLVSDTVIVGTVPDTYLDISGLSGPLNLVPQQ